MFEVSSRFEIEKKSQNRNFLSVRAITVNHEGEEGRREGKRTAQGSRKRSLSSPKGCSNPWLEVLPTGAPAALPKQMN